MIEQPETDATRAGYDLESRLLFRLFRVSNLVSSRCTHWMAECGVTVQQWSVIAAVASASAEAGMTMNQLSDYLLVSRQSLTDLLDRLETRGLIRRLVDPVDRRSRRIVLTQAGKALLPEVIQRSNDFYAVALDGFSQADQQQLMGLIDRLKDNLTRT